MVTHSSHTFLFVTKDKIDPLVQLARHDLRFQCLKKKGGNLITVNLIKASRLNQLTRTIR